MDSKDKSSLLPENDQEKQGMPLFNEALLRFDLSTVKLQDSYNQLREQVHSLTIELGKKHEQLERNLREKEKTEKHLSSIFESLPDGVVVVDDTGIITTFNRGAELIAAVTRNDIEGKPFIQTLKPLLSPDFPADLRNTSGLPSTGECLLTQEGGREIQVHFTIIPLREKESTTGTEIESSIIIFKDVTQLRKLEEQAERTSRLTAMGEIAVSIAHEVRNPVMSIGGLTRRLQKGLASDDHAVKYTEIILQETARLEKMVN
ncbi:MAG: PAS domain S-box protein, partial [Thermodesulfobacteriota bacterium]|nr:PAS domain S-box protein [Thermodesulfobacteriota bacterium]